MKILLAASYIYDKRYPEFTRNSTGFGILIKQILDYVSKNNEIYLVSHVLTKGHEHILPHTLGKVLLHAKPKDLFQGIKWALKYKQSLKMRLKYIYYCLNKGFVRHTIKKMKPDLVHVHGAGLPTKTVIEVCEELGVKYALTLHGLIGLDDSVKTPKWNKDHEREVLLACEKKNVPVTVISTGIKNRIEERYLGAESHSITVVPNGTDVELRTVEKRVYDLRRDYHIPESGHIAVAVGTIKENKNQMQIVEAMAMASREKDLYVFLCGMDQTNGKVQERINELGLQNRVFVLGFVPYEHISDIYEQADYTVLASINEGFGISIIEGFVHGLPNLTFANLDAVPDLFDPKAMLLCESRDTEAFAAAMGRMLDEQWDPAWIKEYSKQFSLEKMAENYQRVYEKAVNS